MKTMTHDLTQMLTVLADLHQALLEIALIKRQAIIDGDLVYRSPREAEIAPGAQIRGTILHEPIERPTMPMTSPG